MTATATAATPTEPAVSGRPTLRPGEWATIVYVGALLVVGVPNVSSSYWSPKAAVLLVALVPGLVALGRLIATRDGAAIAAGGFVLVAAVSTVLSPSPLLSVVGLYVEGTGLLFVGALAGSWALGRRLSPHATRILGGVLLGAAVANAVMAWLQMSSSFSGGLFTRVDGRAPAMLGNPVHATAFLVGAFALAVERAREPVTDVRTTRIGYIALCALFASGVQLTGGRTGLVLLGVVALLMLLRSGWRTTAIVVAVTALGVVVASTAFTSGGGAASRLADSGDSSLDGRLDRWEMAIPAIADRPVFGIGPGLYRRATSPHDTIAAARAFGPDSLYEDGHNLLVTYAATTGLLGLVALATWLVLAAVGARGELVWFTAFAAASLLLQPQFLALTPVLALALGAASPRPTPPDTRLSRALVAVGLVVGVIAAGMLLRGDHALDTAAREQTRSAAREAERLLPMWPDAPAVTVRMEETRARNAHGVAAADAARRARQAARTAIRRDPSAPLAWLTLGRLELDHGDLRAADRAFRTARRWNPESTAAFDGLARVAARRGDDAAVTRWCRRYRAVFGRVRCPSTPD